MKFPSDKLPAIAGLAQSIEKGIWLTSGNVISLGNSAGLRHGPIRHLLPWPGRLVGYFSTLHL